jgi:hypothetical protein
MNMIIQNFTTKLTRQEPQKTCCAAWMERASKFKESGLLDIL